MNLHALLQKRAHDARPVRVGVIGAGKFASMFLSQARLTPGLHVMGVADLNPGRAHQALQGLGWTREETAAPDFAAALKNHTVHVTDDALALIAASGLDVVVDATGDALAGIEHVEACCREGRHVVMVNVEADALAGPLLAERAARAGIVYSLAYGDQPALIAEQVDWARAIGLKVVAAGKGTLYMPHFHASTPDTVWDHYGISAERAKAGGMNAKMFNSFLDGTKSAIEMAAVANACGLGVPKAGLGFPPCEPKALASTLIPKSAGGVLEGTGLVEVVSSRARDGRDLADDLRWGVYVTFEAPTDYVARCFGEYGLLTDPTGRYSALWRPYHLIGLELGVSVASVALRGEPTGCPRAFAGDVAAVAKRDLAAGEMLDGEGGYTVWGRLMGAADSIEAGALPIGLASGVRLTRAVAAGQVVCAADVTLDETSGAVRFRREMEARFAGPKASRASGGVPK